MKKMHIKRDSQRRDLMRVGKRVPLDEALESSDEAKAEEYARCPHCYREDCEGCERKYRPSYSPDDYQPYQQTEDDMIAWLDLNRELGSQAIIDALTVEYVLPGAKTRKPSK